MQPRLTGRFAAEAIARGVGGHVRFLGDVRRQGRLTDDSERSAKRPRIGALVERPEILDLESEGHGSGSSSPAACAVGHMLEMRLSAESLRVEPANAAEHVAGLIECGLAPFTLQGVLDAAGRASTR